MAEDDAQYHAPEDFEDKREEQPQIASADAVNKFLRERCGVDLADATIGRLLAGDLALLDRSEEGLVRWAANVMGSPVHPTCSPAHRDAIPPRILLVTDSHVDIFNVIEQFNAYGADVIVVGYGDDAHMWQEIVPSGDAIRLSATARFDIAWLYITNVHPLLMVTDWLHQRQIPYVFSPWGLPFVPDTVQANAIFLPVPLMVNEFREVVANRFPDHILARLDLNQPMVGGWDNLDYLEERLSRA